MQVVIISFKRVGNNNVLTDKHIENIMELFDSKTDIEHIAKSIDNKTIAEKDYTLSVSEYLEPKTIKTKLIYQS